MSRRSRNAALRGDAQVTGTLGQIPEPMVIALLRAARRRHATHHPLLCRLPP
jgi:hypothetical protein